jgi:hemerythrin-like domain-containing protein
MASTRRDFILAGATVALGASAMSARVSAAEPAAKSEAKPKDKGPAEDVSAPEDLMREHGVLRRIVLVYREGLRRIQAKEEVKPGVFHEAATLIRQFVEDYHEKLEEDHVFPEFEKRKQMLPLVTALRKQHAAGRALTDVMLKNATAERFGQAAPRQELVTACVALLRMYEPHAAREDTVLFPAFHHLLSPERMDKLGDEFEDEENRRFGQNGFEKMVEQVAGLEKQLGIYELDQFTPAKG